MSEESHWSSGLVPAVAITGACILFPITGVGLAVATGVAGTLATPLAVHSSNWCMQRLIRRRELLNHDLQKAILHAFDLAMDDLQKEWSNSYQRDANRAYNSGESSEKEVKSLFADMRKHAKVILSDDRLSSILGSAESIQLFDRGGLAVERKTSDNEPEDHQEDKAKSPVASHAASSTPMETPENYAAWLKAVASMGSIRLQVGDEQDAFTAYLNPYLEDHSEQLKRFMRNSFQPLLACRFGEELKKDTKAWRAFQRLVNDSLLDGVREMLDRQNAAQATLDHIVSELKEWKIRLTTLPDTHRESTGEAGLEDLITALSHQLDTLRKEMDRLAKATWERIEAEGNETRGEVDKQGVNTRQHVTQEIERTREVIREETGAILSDVHAIEKKRRDEGAEQRSAALADYFGAVELLCNTLPFSIGGANDNSFADLYVEHVLEQVPGVSHPVSAPATPALEQASIDRLLTNHRHLLIEGDPGAGKSTLIDMLTLRLLEADRSGASVPIPIPVAADQFVHLAGGFTERLAEHLTQRLGERLRKSLPSDFFSAAPFQNGEWLIMLDGLDQISDPFRIATLISALTREVREENLKIHRFVITSRPTSDLQKLADNGFSFYRLRPFGPEQIRYIVIKWFGQEHMGWADRFLDEVDQRLIKDLMQVPLLLIMALRIFEQSSAKQLPTKRIAFYRQFISQMNVRDQFPAASRWQHFLEQWRRDYPDGERIAKDLYAHKNRRTVVTHLAVWQQEGHQGSLLAEAQRFAEREGWLPPSTEANELLRATIEFPLLQTGILVRRDGDLAFVHDTFREFLAAEAFAGANTPCDSAAWDWVVRWPDPRWQETVRFLLEIWSDDGKDVTPLLEWICRPLGKEANMNGVLFVGSMLALGLSVATYLKDQVVDELLQWARMDFSTARGLILPTVSKLRHLPQIQIGVIELLEDPRAYAETRLQVARLLGEWGQGEVTIPVLQDLLEDEGTMSHSRLEALRLLAALGEEEMVIRELQVLLDVPALQAWYRLEAASLLRTLGEEVTAVRELQTLLEDSRAQDDDRLKAARLLGEWGQGEATIPILQALLQNPRANTSYRCEAAGLLGALGQEDVAVHGLQALLEDPPATSGITRMDAQFLRVWGPREDRSAESRNRRKAASLLRTLGGEATAVPELQALLEDSGADVYERLEAARLLGEWGQGQATVPVLQLLLEDRTNNTRYRVEAASLLGALGQKDSAVRQLQTLLEDSGADVYERLEAARLLGEWGQGQATVPVLQLLLEDRTNNTRYRVEAASLLGALGLGSEAVQALREAGELKS